MAAMSAPSAAILVAAVALLAGAVASVAGFGIGSLLTPLLALWFPTGVAVAFVALPHALATLIRWLGLRRDVSWTVFRQFGLASAVGGLTGAALQSRLASPVLSGVLGALLLVAGLGELTRRAPPLPRSAVGGWLGGILSGFFGGLVGNQGGIRSAALLRFGLTPREIVATATAPALLVDLARVPVYLATRGRDLGPTLPLLLPACAGAVAGTLIGVPILRRIPAGAFHRLLGILLVVLALFLFRAALWPAPRRPA